jgi:hypothetical protein
MDGRAVVAGALEDQVGQATRTVHVAGHFGALNTCVSTGLGLGHQRFYGFSGRSS